jgi:DNA repair exonuclease SbcCD ATPase subunit
VDAAAAAVESHRVVHLALTDFADALPAKAAEKVILLSPVDNLQQWVDTLQPISTSVRELRDSLPNLERLGALSSTVANLENLERLARTSVSNKVAVGEKLKAVEEQMAQWDTCPMCGQSMPQSHQHSTIKE